MFLVEIYRPLSYPQKELTKPNCWHLPLPSHMAVCQWISTQTRVPPVGPFGHLQLALPHLDDFHLAGDGGVGRGGAGRGGVGRGGASGLAALTGPQLVSLRQPMLTYAADHLGHHEK